MLGLKSVLKNENNSPAVTIETKAKPCPGVEEAIIISEDALTRGEMVMTNGLLIHNEREMDRLENMGLQKISEEELFDPAVSRKLKGQTFLVRCHGEEDRLVSRARELGMKILDGTCPIVQRSQKIVRDHAWDGWRVVIAGKKGHAEVKALLAKTRGHGIAVASVEEAEHLDIESRTLLIAQTTIDPDLFSGIRDVLLKKCPGMKIIDTTCRFIGNRSRDVVEFGQTQDVVILVGGEQSSNCQLLYEQLLKVNPRAARITGPGDLAKANLKKALKIGITGGASTPHWQLEEMKRFVEDNHFDANPKGLNNRKGGTRKWQIWKNQKIKN